MRAPERWSRSAMRRHSGPWVSFSRGPEMRDSKRSDHAPPWRWSRNAEGNRDGPRRAVFHGPEKQKAKELDHVWTQAVVQECGIQRDQTTDPLVARSRNSAGLNFGPCAPPGGGPERAWVQILNHAAQFPVVQKWGRQKRWTTRAPGRWPGKRAGSNSGPCRTASCGPGMRDLKRSDHARPLAVVQK